MPRRFPKDEGFDKVNFIIDSWSTGCDAPWYIYIETMGPAALEAFIVMLSFGWADVVRGRLRPRGLGRRSSKRKGKWSRRIPRFPEIGNTLGKSIPVGEQLEDFVKWGNKTRFLWRIDNLIQAGLFMWLIVDVAEDFVFNWTSLLYDSYWCQPDPPGAFSARATGYSNIFDNTWKLSGFNVIDYNRGPPTWGFLSGSTGSNPATVTAVLKVKKRVAFDPPTSFEVRVFDKADNSMLLTSGVLEADASGDATAIASGCIPANTTFEVRAYMTGTAAAWYGDGVVIGQEILE